MLAERFAELVGCPPMQYLTLWRMQLAARLLADGRAKVAGAAHAVGYESEAAFSRAFKKATGVPPADWRRAPRGRAGAAQRQLSSPAWRMAARIFSRVGSSTGTMGERTSSVHLPRSERANLVGAGLGSAKAARCSGISRSW